MGIVASFFYSQLFVNLPYPDASWTGKTVIVTGANVGLGKEAARHFVRLGASKVILAVRSIEKGEDAKADIVASQSCYPDVVEVWSLDLQDYDSVKAFAQRCQGLERIDAVVENAGIVTWSFRLVNGHEASVETNVIATFLLALLLLPKLKETADRFSIKPYLVIVSSDVHYMANFNERKSPKIFDALQDKENTDMNDRYNVTKLLEVYVVREWVRLYMSNDYPVILNAVNPGLCHSELGREVGWPMTILKALFARTTEMGSRALVNAASAGKETHGEFMWDCKVKTPAKLVVGSEGPDLQKRVWNELKEILEEIEPGVTNGF
jgi:retinol dehydrogenase 12